MPNRKNDAELTRHACDSHCAHQDRFGLVSRTDAKSNKAPNHQPEQNAVLEGLETVTIQYYKKITYSSPKAAIAAKSHL